MLHTNTPQINQINANAIAVAYPILKPFSFTFVSPYQACKWLERQAKARHKERGMVILLKLTALPSGIFHLTRKFNH